MEQTLKRNGRTGGAEVRNRYGAILAAAKRFLCRAIDASGNAMPRVMNVDKNPSYPAAVEALKAEAAIRSRVVLHQSKCLNNVIEQDHCIVKKRVWLAKGYGSFSDRLADTTGNRNSTHNSEGPSEVVGKRGCGGPRSLHRLAVRHRCLTRLDHSQLCSDKFASPKTSQRNL